MSQAASSQWKTEAEGQFHCEYPLYLLKTKCVTAEIKVNIKKRVGEDKLPPEKRMQLEEVQCTSDWRHLASMLPKGVG